MAKAPTRQTGNFEFRVGVGDFAYSGMMMDPDPGAIPANRLRLVRNGRYQGGGVVSKPPYDVTVPIEKFIREEYVDGVLTAAYGFWDLQYLTEHHPAFPVRVWYGGEGGDGTGGYIGFIDLDGNPMIQPVGSYAQVVSRTPSIAKFDGDIYVGEYGFLRKIYQIQTPSGITPIEYGSLPADEIIWNFGAGFVDVLHSHLGKLYMLVMDPTGVANGKIYSFDGVTIILEYTLGIPGNQGACAVTWQDKLVFGIRGLGSVLVKAADGTWSTATCEGFEVSPNKNSMASAAGGVWIADGSSSLFFYDGATLSLGGTLAAPWSQVLCCAALGGQVYFGSSASLGGGETVWRHRIGTTSRLDDTLLYFSPDTLGGSVDAMVAHGGRLIVSYNGILKTHPTPYVLCTGTADQTEEFNGWFTFADYAPVVPQGSGTFVNYLVSA